MNIIKHYKPDDTKSIGEFPDYWEGRCAYFQRLLGGTK
jgi:hypothetical protein